MKGQQGHATLQGSHAALIGKPNAEGVIDYLHTRDSNYITGYVMHYREQRMTLRCYSFSP